MRETTEKLDKVRELLDELVELGVDYSQFMWAKEAHKELKKSKKNFRQNKIEHNEKIN